MDAPPPPTTPDANAKWWIAWIIAVVVIPGAGFPVMEALSRGEVSEEVILLLGGLAAVTAFVLHLTASIKASKGRSGWLTALLLLGGWVLGFASLFAGCIVAMS